MSINDLSAGSGMAANDWLYDVLANSPARRDGGTPARPNVGALTRLYDSMDTTPVDIVILGDSLIGINNLTSVSELTARIMSRLGGGRLAPTSYAGMTTANILSMTSQQGTATTACPGARGATMAPGNKATLTIDCDGVSVSYACPGAAELTVRSSVAGTTIGTLTAEDFTFWTSGSLSSASRTIEIENTGSADATLAFVQPHNKNRASGVRVIDLAKSGAAASAYVDNTDRGVDFIEANQPDAVVIEFGTNGTNHVANLTTLIGMIRDVAPSTTIVGVVPYKNAQFTWTEIRDIQTLYASLCDEVVDWAVTIGDADALNLTIDTVHPVPQLSWRCAVNLCQVLSGDPLTVAALTQDQRLTIEAGSVSFDGKAILGLSASDTAALYLASPLGILFGSIDGNIHLKSNVYYSPDGTGWRVTIDNTGTQVITEIV